MLIPQTQVTKGVLGENDSFEMKFKASKLANTEVHVSIKNNIVMVMVVKFFKSQTLTIVLVKRIYTSVSKWPSEF